VSDRQWAAVHAWVVNGGKLLLSAGRNSQLVFATPTGISQFVPGRFSGASLMRSSARIEYYSRSGSGKQLIAAEGDPVPIASLENIDGTIDLEQDGQAIIVRKPLGFGQIVFSAIDLDLPPVKEWTGQKNLILKLFKQQENLNVAAPTRSPSGVVHFGYTDMVGQLLAPLEQFSHVGLITFTLVATLIVFFILCIGPGDFFMLRRVFGRMEWTWLTFLLMCVLFCGLAVFIARWSRPRQFQVNQLEIIDVDGIGGTVRGSMWTNIFSPKNATYDVDLSGRNSLGFELDNNMICWQGLPGTGLGGMETKAGDVFFDQPYRCRLLEVASEHSSTTQTRSGVEPIRMEIQQMPIGVSATKALFLQWWSRLNQPVRSRLRIDQRRGRRLQGTLTNPFPMAINNCRVLFENSAYLMDRPLEANETVDIGSDTRERTATVYLTQRIQEAGEDVSGDWNPQDMRINRISDLLMFYGAAGGQNYTGLTHGYQRFIDLSEHLYLGRAILVGEIEQLGTEIGLTSESGSANYDSRTTMIRVCLPVRVEN
jgi:hypothetical protein